MTETININDTVAQLEGLYNGYSSILKDAKEQLSSIDLKLTDEQLKDLATKVVDNNGFSTNVVRDLRDTLATEVGELDESILNQVSYTIQERMEEKYLKVTREAIEQKIEQVLSDGLLERLIERRIQQSQEMNEFIDIAAAMSRVVNSVDRIQAMQKAKVDS